MIQFLKKKKLETNSVMDNIKRENDMKVQRFNKELWEAYGYTIPRSTLNELALMKLLDYYTISEIHNILEYYEQAEPRHVDEEE